MILFFIKQLKRYSKLFCNYQETMQVKSTMPTERILHKLGQTNVSVLHKQVNMFVFHIINVMNHYL